MTKMSSMHDQQLAERKIDGFRQALGPFVVAAEASRMAMVFTSAIEDDHPIVFVNDAFLSLVGYARDEVIGQPFGFLLGSVEPDVRERIRCQFDDGLETLDVECRRKDGGRIWVALCIHPVVDQLGLVAQHCASFVDLSAQMQRMRHERTALHALYQHTPDFIAITEGPDHRFTFANAAYQALVGPRDLLGRTVAEALPELVSQQIVKLLDEAYRSGERFLGEAIGIKLQREAGADVELRFLNLIHQPVRDADGRVTGMFCEGHDVTDQVAVAEQMRTLQAEIIHLSRLSAMGTMAATLAHELTQPLTAISNHAAACRYLHVAEDEDGERIAGGLDAITASAQRAGEIIHRLRDMTKRRKSRREHFDLHDAIRESIALVRPRAGPGTSILNQSDADIELDADRIQIQQVIINLVRNACEAIGPGEGRVTVSTARRRDKIVVSVRDSGSGVSPDATKSLFTWAESTKPEGTGIGLSICRTIVKAHDGDLWLAESGPRGSRFSFSLPAEPRSRAQPAG